MTGSAYGYTDDNPLNGSDPTGLCWPVCTAAIGALVGATAGAAGSIGSQLITKGRVSWTKVGIAAGAGAIGGAMFGTCGWCAGAVAGGLGDAATQLYDKKTTDLTRLNPLEIGAAVVFGGALGGLFDLPNQLNDAMKIEASTLARGLWGVFGGTLAGSADPTGPFFEPTNCIG